MNFFSKSKDLKIIFVILTGNIFLVILKIGFGYTGQSSALIADGFHSIGDIFGTILALIAVKISLAPPDKGHPYGHGKIEPIVSTSSSIFLFLISFEIIYSSISRVFTSAVSSPKPIAMIGALISIIVNELLFRYSNRYGREKESTAIIAISWDKRSDALSSVTALLGISLSQLGYPILDSIAAIIIALMVGMVAYRLLISGSLEIMDTSIPGFEKKVVDVAESVCGVEHAYARARKIGRQIHIDLKLEMEPTMSVLDSHELGKKVQDKIMSQFQPVDQVMIHVQPHE